MENRNIRFLIKMIKTGIRNFLICNLYNLNSKVVVTITDNGSNFVKAFKIFGQPKQTDNAAVATKGIKNLEKRKKTRSGADILEFFKDSENKLQDESDKCDEMEI